ncbi:ATP synthase F1 subcomplex delta subunit [Kordia periserrulae]|uniref:ATP synthase subunit delta n=1 Tax=Kordia periserrulae TaxID=701523 RepID=A0A2T6BWD8_9FLAO|nr:ATP synthase F1 subunit delta [Kordia periserrulae]PTX60395.1 ATP synthase F1 subcomplex delta subunit [Kordia periserrulae]
MAGSRAAIRYAKAILALAQEQNAGEAVAKDMDGIVKTVAGSKELRVVLNSPIVKQELKKAALQDIFKNGHSITEEFINILIDNKRVKLLGDVAAQYGILYDASQGKEKAVVTTAVPLTDVLRDKVLQKVKDLTGNQVTIENKIDESIIGGFILRVGDLQYNASIANQLNTLKRTFSQN